MLDRQIGHYRLLKKLGVGGMGEVYLAEDCLLQRLIALKTLSPMSASQTHCLLRFQREARSVAALNHPNIVTIYSVEESEGIHFLTMEVVEGKTLTATIPPGGLPLQRILDIAVPLAEALGAAHERGIVHRDLKPDNIMVNHEGRVKVLDFGIAKMTSDLDVTLVDGWEREETLTEAGFIPGTPAYMAPEQILGAPVDQRTDLFAFGVILFQMATGQRPFRGMGLKEVCDSILRDPPPRPSSLNPQVPIELDTLIGCCLEKNVSQRIQSAAGLRERLQHLAIGLSASQSPAILAPNPLPSPPEQGRWQRPAMLVSVAACLILALTMGGARLSQIPVPGSRPAAPAEITETRRPGLAVLPLGNFSNDPEYFVDGMTDCLISSLADIRGVRVISRQSVMRFKGSSRPLPQIAGELGVQLIVQGSVLRAGNKVRVTAQLIRAAPDEQQLWASSYERDLRDVLGLQNEVARAIAQEIEVKLDPADRKRLASGRLVDPKAHDLYLRGRHARNRATSDSIGQALSSFKEALGRDPGFALAHAALADAYAWAGGNEILPPVEAYQQARHHAKAALEIDPELADAYVALGFIQMLADRDMPGAEASFRRALALQPNHPTAHYFYWAFLHANGRRAEAREQIRIAAELDPLSPIITLNLGVEDCLEGNEAEALKHWRKVQILDPDNEVLHLYLSVLYLRKGKLDLSYHSLRKFLALCYPEITPQVDRAHRKGGDKAALEAAAQALEDLSRRRPIPAAEVVHIYLLLGQRDKAVDWLEKVYDRGSPMVVFFRASWTLQSLQSEPRFQDLLKKVDRTPVSPVDAVP